jgi:hypothetical protein
LHPIGVYHMLLNVGHSDTVLAVALLHDILEDYAEDVKVRDLAAVFPADVVEAVVALTRIPGEKYMAYIDRLSKKPHCCDREEGGYPLQHVAESRGYVGKRTGAFVCALG